MHVVVGKYVKGKPWVNWGQGEPTGHKLRQMGNRTSSNV